MNIKDSYIEAIKQLEIESNQLSDEALEVAKIANNYINGKPTYGQIKDNLDGIVNRVRKMYHVYDDIIKIKNKMDMQKIMNYR